MKHINNYKKYSISFFIILMLILPSPIMAKMYMQTQVISGQATAIKSDNMITLDDGSTYLSEKQDMALNISSGQIISIRFFTNAKGENIYIETAPGENSIDRTPVPKDNSRRKSKL